MAAFHCCFSPGPDFQQDSLVPLQNWQDNAHWTHAACEGANSNFSIGKLAGRAELDCAAPAANFEKEDDSESPR